ncbi:hypothetical protein CLAIMM_01673 isoform 1 [Cladophialophora immunda]|nr:hypothetical protein CLAIMM_01673 isoform 1 [Cladophialophora immunda]
MANTTYQMVKSATPLSLSVTKANPEADNHNERFSDLGSVRRTGSDRPQQQSQTQPQPQPQPQRPSKPQPKSPPKPPPKPSGEPSIPGVS